MSANLQFLVLIIKCNQLHWPPSALPSPVCPPPNCSASSTHPALRCAVVRSQSWGLQQIILPTGWPTQLRAARTQRADLSLWKCRTHAFQQEAGGIGSNHTPGKYHRKGIYFMGYTRQDNQPLFRTATGPRHCERTATASPVNLLMHCTKSIPHGLSDSHEPHKALSAVSPFTWGIWTLLLFHSVSFVDPPEASVTSHHHQHVSELPKPHRSLSSGGERLILSPPCLLHRLLDFQPRFGGT